jgi:NADH:ubiquinone oxidoreductase subunit H
MMAAVAELTRPPFDMPVADSEIIFGAYTEYTGLKFAFFLLSEYGGIVVMSAVASVLFLGGYLPLPGALGDPRADLDVRQDLRAVVRDRLAARDVPAPA